MKHIDLRSDTVTEPTQEMRDSILTAEYGDWSYGEDKTIMVLQKKVAEMFGAEDATYVPSGVFGNQAMLLSVGKPGDEVIVADKSHLVRYENGSIGFLSRMMARTIPSTRQGFIEPQVLKKYMRKVTDNQAPHSKILVIENPTSEGRIYPLEQLRELIEIGRKNGLHVHLDGARLFHAVLALNLEPKELVKGFDSVMFCLSKGLGAPIGSMVVGSKSMISQLRVNRKRMGGNLRKPGVIAYSGIIALDNYKETIGRANESAQKLASRLQKLGWVDFAEKVEINMIFFRFTKEIDCEKFREHLLSYKIKSFISKDWKMVSRFVLHHYIDDKAIETIIRAFEQFPENSQKSQIKA